MEENIKLKEELADAIIETQEIKELKEIIQDKRDEIDDNNDWELSDRDFDEELDSIYPEVEIAGNKYFTSNALKNVDSVMYDQMREDMSENLRDEKGEELKEELMELEDELTDLLGGEE